MAKRPECFGHHRTAMELLIVLVICHLRNLLRLLLEGGGLQVLNHLINVLLVTSHFLEFQFEVFDSFLEESASRRIQETQVPSHI